MWKGFWTLVLVNLLSGLYWSVLLEILKGKEAMHWKSYQEIQWNE